MPGAILDSFIDPKAFGHIPGVAVGTKFKSRQECCDARVHRQIFAGIVGDRTEGARSVVLSGGYEDDEDFGETFTYTGSGGRDLTSSDGKRLLAGPQAFDQTFEDGQGNMALKISSITKRPVRVVRGSNLSSEYAPASGYRYDGLYVVERAWIERGKKGYNVCKYAFRRLENQPPLPRMGWVPAVPQSSRRPLEMAPVSMASTRPTSSGLNASIPAHPYPVNTPRLGDMPSISRARYVAVNSVAMANPSASAPIAMQPVDPTLAAPARRAGAVWRSGGRGGTLKVVKR